MSKEGVLYMNIGGVTNRWRKEGLERERKGSVDIYSAPI